MTDLYLQALAHRNQLTDGLRHLLHDRVLGHLLIGFGLSLLVLGLTESAILALTDHFDRPATYVSVIVSVQGIGAVVGGLASARCVRRLGEVATSVLGLALLGLSALGIAASPVMAGVLASIVVFGASLPLLVVAYMTLLQRRLARRRCGARHAGRLAVDLPGHRPDDARRRRARGLLAARRAAAARRRAGVRRAR